MKKTFVLMLTVMFLVAAFSGSALAMAEVAPLPEGDGADAYTSGFAPEPQTEFEHEKEYHQRAVEFLAEKYQMAPEDIQLLPGRVEKLEHMGRSFWGTNFHFGTKDKSEFGGVYIDLDSEKIYLRDEVDSLFKQEQEKIREEYEQLQKEAGKIEVELYRQMQKMPDDEKLLTSTIPTYQPDEELLAEIEQLQQEYADVAELVDDENNVIASNRKDDVPFDQERMRQYLEKLIELKQKGYQQALENVSQFMEDNAIEYEAKEGYREPRVEAKLGKGEIEALADKDFVGSIRREVIYTIMETGAAADSAAGGVDVAQGQPEIDKSTATENDAGQTTAREDESADADSSDNQDASKGSGSMPFIAGGVVLLGGLAFFLKKK
ncbi:hypothetical protein MFMK1_001709 [Metallumcola ferriviriculae]|uniref:Uncharacterized protein n=1 Tax=Metallumcola ferriviriculae TaxID=3039180 RepID=A0AAU0UMP9_9FIRM|nr:hypothetical protein MFMK1_001709 [Desulfitibacteraceae bacterium MK1]